jgi:serine/threonine protein phosphatase 1
MRKPLRRLPPRRSLRAEIDATLVPAHDAPQPVAEAGVVGFVRAPGWLRPGVRFYAVGDVHGCADQLAELHEAILADAARRPTGKTVVVHLGDYIDLGPDSAAVVERLSAGAPAGLLTVNLAGDHEQMLLDALAGDRAAATDWLEAGGGGALQSWGIDPAAPREQWPALIPERHLAFLRSLRPSHRADGYLFVHAGIRPGVPLAQQTRDDLQRMRQPFLYSEQDHGVVVVHGHTSSAQPVIARNRIGLDTGAGIGGALTCAVLEDDALGFLTA